MINRIKFILFILFVLIFSSNCVEHKIGITVEPGGSFIYSHFIEGDKNDILDLDYPIPTSPEWNIKNNITDESDIYFYSFEKDLIKINLYHLLFIMMTHWIEIYC